MHAIDRYKCNIRYTESLGENAFIDAFDVFGLTQQSLFSRPFPATLKLVLRGDDRHHALYCHLLHIRYS